MKLMRSRYGRMLGLTLAVSLVIALGVQPGRSQQSDDAGFLPMQTSVNALMVALVDHAAHELWEMGSRETLTARDWQTTEQHATQLIASGTLISLGGTGTADPSWAAAPDWQEWSRDLTDAGAAALAAARTTDQDALHAAGLALLDACEGCHRAFKPELPTEGLTHFPHYEISSRGTVTLKAAV
ncbi:MAG TPA: cytochrome c, partial [Gammaproteobacteria bacterium]|nr:cytochrome c [Gammaproteobacteria bacterium]